MDPGVMQGREKKMGTKKAAILFGRPKITLKRLLAQTDVAAEIVVQQDRVENVWIDKKICYKTSLCQ